MSTRGSDFKELPCKKIGRPLNTGEKRQNGGKNGKMVHQ